MLDPSAYRTLIGPHGRNRLEEIHMAGELTENGWTGTDPDFFRWLNTHPCSPPVFFSAPRQLVDLELDNCEIIWPRSTWLDEVQNRIGGTDPTVWMNAVWPKEIRQKTVPSLVPFWLACKPHARFKGILLKEIVR